MNRTPLPPLRLHLPVRSTEAEILDGEGFDADDLERSLNQMAWVNRHLGGLRGLSGPLRSVADSLDGPLRLLDVGTGNGNLPRSLAHDLTARGRKVRWIGVDLRHRVLRLARRAGRENRIGATPPEQFLQANGLALPLADSSVDVVTSSLTLHHLTDLEAAGFLAELARVARHRVLVSDLERHPLHYAGARLLASTVWRADPVTRIDGPLSVLRAFTRTELRSLAEAAPLTDVRIRRSIPFRLLLEGAPA